jgi:hypothetical protein
LAWILANISGGYYLSGAAAEFRIWCSVVGYARSQNNLAGMNAP